MTASAWRPTPTRRGAGALPPHHRSRRDGRRLACGRHLRCGSPGRGRSAGAGPGHVPHHPGELGGQQRTCCSRTTPSSVPPRRAWASTPRWWPPSPIRAPPASPTPAWRSTRSYYYRVYAVSPYGTFSPDSPHESTARTLNNPPPFADDFEGSLVNWNLTGTWGITTNDAHGGLACLADSPGSTYAQHHRQLCVDGGEFDGDDVAGAAVLGPGAAGQRGLGAGGGVARRQQLDGSTGCRAGAQRVGRAEH